MNEEQMRAEFEAWWANFQSEHDEWRFADREALLFQAWQAALQAKSVPEGWTLVPKIGTKVKANHPITCINPEEYFAVHEIQAFGGNITVRGEDTCWFGMNTIAAPQPPQSIEADKVRELEKDAARYRWLCENKFVNWAQVVGFYFDADTGIDQAIDEAMKRE